MWLGSCCLTSPSDYYFNFFNFFVQESCPLPGTCVALCVSKVFFCFDSPFGEGGKCRYLCRIESVARRAKVLLSSWGWGGAFLPSELRDKENRAPHKPPSALPRTTLVQARTSPGHSDSSRQGCNGFSPCSTGRRGLAGGPACRAASSISSFVQMN